MQLQFESLADFWAMNGHGSYVWLAYTITLVVLVYLVVSPLLQTRQFLQQQRKLQRLAEQNLTQ
jgi:heme exporter protein D